MKLKPYFHLVLYSLLGLSQITHTDINFPKPKLDQIRASFKMISPIILKLGQSKIPNPFIKDIDAINQTLSSYNITNKNIESILNKLSKIKSALLDMDPNTKIYIPKAFGTTIVQPLGIFLATTYKKFTSDLKLIVQSSEKIANLISANNAQLIQDSFKPIFWGFYDLFEHPYYKYLDAVREAIHLGLNKEKLILIKEIMSLLLTDLNDENQNQTMTLETRAYQKFNLTISDFKELIKKFINTLDSLIK